MSLILHGHAVSNYFNTVRAVLIERQMPFTIQHGGASRDEAFLARSPLGKIPFLETPKGFISETVAILEYLEDTQADHRLHPADPLLRARGRQIINITQLYLDAPLRQLYPGVYAAGNNHERTVTAVAKQMDVTLDALRRVLVCQPYLLGATATLTDFFCLYAFDLSNRVTQRVYGWSLLERLPGLKPWAEAMRDRDSTHTVTSDFLTALGAYLHDKQAHYQLRDGGGLLTSAQQTAQGTTA